MADYNTFVFNTGFKNKKEITFFEKKFNIIVKLQAYSEKDGITSQQKKAYEDFCEKEVDNLKKAEQMLFDNYPNAKERFAPTMLLILRDGEISLLFDDDDDPDEGVAVVLTPQHRILDQSEYL